MSRNKDRLGNRTVQHSDPPPQATEQHNTENTERFSFVVPTEHVELPSQGRFYSTEHPLHNESSIEIRQMTAKEEDLLTSRSLLKKGTALERVIKNLIVNKRINPDTLLVGDRNAIMIAARISGYGSEYNTSVTCPSCSAKIEHSFDLHESTINSGESSDSLGVREEPNGIFSTILPKTRCEVRFRLLRGTDEKTLLQQIENARKRNREENAVTRQLRMLIVSVNGDDSMEAINYFVENVPSLDAQHLRTAFANATPNVDLTQYFNCHECGYETEMEVPLSADFFWPKR